MGAFSYLGSERKRARVIPRKLRACGLGICSDQLDPLTVDRENTAQSQHPAADPDAAVAARFAAVRCVSKINLPSDRD